MNGGDSHEPVLTNVYTALPDEAPKVAQLLASRGLHPAVVDDTEKMGTYRSHEVRIAVPAAERDRAIRILADMEQREVKRLSPLLRVTNRIILVLVIALGIVATVGLFDRGGKWFIAACSLLTALAAAFLIRRAWPPKHSPGDK